MRSKTLLIGVMGIVIGVLLSTAVVFAGSLNPPTGPGDPSSQMVTVQQLWDRINNGAAATKMTAFTEPNSGPAATGKTLDDLYTLASERSRPAKTGPTTCYAANGAVIACAGTGQDGDLKKGVAWPSPRFTDNGNGTVTNILTGLIWLKNANCYGLRQWATALTDANTLNSGECGLTDGSAEGDWRLPNVREQHSLIDYRNSPALPSGHPFTGVQLNYYWTSTSAPDVPSLAYGVDLAVGLLGRDGKAATYRVWPVRGGQ